MAKFRSIFTFEPGGPMSKLFLPAGFRKRQSETRFKQEWKMSSNQYSSMMKYQRGNLNMFPAGSTAVTGISAGSVLMTGASSNHTTVGTICHAGIVFNNDGSIDDLGPGLGDLAQVDAGEWWTEEPEADIGSSYDVRVAGTGSGSWDIAAAADNTWIDMSVNRTWRVTVIAKDSPDVQSASDTFEIGLTGAATALDSGLYTASVEN